MWKIFRTDVVPRPSTRWLLSTLLFIGLIVGYLTFAHVRRQENPDDKIAPSVTEMANAVKRVTTQPDRQGNIWLWMDLKATGKRFGWSLLIISLGSLIGLHMGLFPYIESFLGPFVTAFDKIVALSLLPFLMILFGIEEGFRIGLVVVGVLPTIILSAQLEAKALPEELMHKAKTLGASEFELCYRVALPLIMPKMLNHLRLNFKAMSSLIIAGEMIVSSEGLGYRINAVRRFMGMDVVVIYVVVITGLLFLLDLAVSHFIRTRYHWADK